MQHTMAVPTGASPLDAPTTVDRAGRWLWFTLAFMLVTGQHRHFLGRCVACAQQVRDVLLAAAHLHLHLDDHHDPARRRADLLGATAPLVRDGLPDAPLHLPGAGGPGNHRRGAGDARLRGARAR